MVPLDLIFGPEWCFLEGLPILEQLRLIKKIKTISIETIFFSINFIFNLFTPILEES